MNIKNLSRRMNHSFNVCRFSLLFAAASFITDVSADDNIKYVDPFIGTTNFSVCNPGAVCPEGMMSVVPFNVMGSDLNKYDKDGRWFSAPYEFHNTYFTGFAHVTLSGVGCPEMGTLLLMPTTGKMDVDYHNYGSGYSNEYSVPGYYSNTLTKYGIKCEVTSTPRTSAERYTFPAGKGNILLNLGDGLTNETGAMVRKVSDTEIEGFRLLGTFCYNAQAVFPMYFVMKINKKPSSQGYWKKQPDMKGVEAQWDIYSGKYKTYTKYYREMAGNEIGYYYNFDLKEGEQVEVQMGVSFVSIENARENLKAEQPSFDFDNIRRRAYDAWNENLNKISVEGGTEDQKKIFYTALYHTQIHPNILQDVNGEYPLMESEGVGRTDVNRYTIFSLWDTYRNLHQLYTLVYPKKQTDAIRTMIDMYREWGWMPKWELFGRETWTMEGDPSIPVIADSYIKGLRDFDINTAYEAFVKSADTEGRNNLMRPDIDPYIEKGYIPMGVYSADASGDNSVSHALEYYIADYSLSLLAKELGKNEDAKKYMARSMGYRHYYSKEFNCLRPINPDGSFFSPFNPEDGANFTNAPGFHEGSAWNYTFYVPHDVYGLAKLMGGKKKFVSTLAGIFEKGLYDPANEPDIAYPYLFTYFKGEEWRTQETVRNLLNKYYKAAPDGIPGNDDCGTMSAWAIFSMMGIYPDCPGSPYYSVTSPVFDKVTIHTDRNYYDSDIVISTSGRKSQNDHIRSLQCGDRKMKSFRISHENLKKGLKIYY